METARARNQRNFRRTLNDSSGGGGRTLTATERAFHRAGAESSRADSQSLPLRMAIQMPVLRQRWIELLVGQRRNRRRRGRVFGGGPGVTGKQGCYYRVGKRVATAYRQTLNPGKGFRTENPPGNRARGEGSGESRKGGVSERPAHAVSGKQCESASADCAPAGWNARSVAINVRPRSPLESLNVRRKTRRLRARAVSILSRYK
jgi:hypothetical protein